MNGSSRSPLREFPKRIVVWAGGFVLTGRVFHGLRWRDLRETDPARAVSELVAFLLVCTIVYWLAFVVPASIVALFVGVPVGLVVIRSVAIGFLLGVIELTNVTQYFYGIHGKTPREYLHKTVRGTFGR